MSAASGNPGILAPYVLGHSVEELERLGRQAKLIDPVTRRFFERAGIAPGMRVLDAGSGAGHTAALTADLVGPSGHVVGVDRESAALRTAQVLIEARSLPNVSFVEGDPATLTFDEPFDAVVGRYVLMFQADPVAMVRAVSRQVRPNGLVVFHEPDWAGVRTYPPAPLYERACQWIVDLIERSGLQARMGIKLHSTFLEAGLPAPDMGLEALIGGGTDLERIRFITEIVGTLQERIVQLGIATASEIDMATLPARIAEEANRTGAALASRSEVGAWCRVDSNPTPSAAARR